LGLSEDSLVRELHKNGGTFILESIQNRTDLNLDKKHPEYDRLVAERRQWLDLWEGGSKITRDYLTKMEGETESEYAERFELVAYPPVAYRALGIFTSHLFANRPTYVEDFPEELNEYIYDCDGEGTDLFSKIKNHYEQQIQPVGYGFFLITTTESQFPIINREQSELANVRVIVEPFSIFDLVDWGIGSDGKLDYIVIKQRVLRSTSVGQDHLQYDLCRVWTRTEWAKYRAEIPSGGGYSFSNRKWVFDSGGVHNLGEIPLVIFYNFRLGFLNGTSEMRFAAEMNRELYNQRSLINLTLKYAAFPWPVIEGNPPNPQEQQSLQVGLRRILYTGSGRKFSFAEYSGSSLEKAISWYNTGVKELLAAVQHSPELIVESATPESGVARLARNANISSIVEEKANNLEEGERRIWYFIQRWLGVDPSDAAEFASDCVSWNVNMNTELIHAELKDIQTNFSLGLLDGDDTLIEMKAQGYISDQSDIRELIQKWRDRQSNSGMESFKIEKPEEVE
jgi:hypothetical protein